MIYLWDVQYNEYVESLLSVRDTCCVKIRNEGKARRDEGVMTNNMYCMGSEVWCQ